MEGGKHVSIECATLTEAGTIIVRLYFRDDFKVLGGNCLSANASQKQKASLGVRFLPQLLYMNRRGNFEASETFSVPITNSLQLYGHIF